MAKARLRGVVDDEEPHELADELEHGDVIQAVRKLQERERHAGDEQARLRVPADGPLRIRARQQVAGHAMMPLAPAARRDDAVQERARRAERPSRGEDETTRKVGRHQAGRNGGRERVKTDARVPVKEETHEQIVGILRGDPPSRPAPELDGAAIPQTQLPVLHAPLPMPCFPYRV